MAKTTTKTKTTKKTVKSKTSTKTSKNPVKKKVTKKPVKKVKKQSVKKPVKKTKIKVTKKPVKKANTRAKKVVRKQKVKLIENKKEEINNSLNLELLDSLYAENKAKDKKIKTLFVISIILFILLVGSIFLLIKNTSTTPSNISTSNNTSEVIVGDPIDNKYKDIWNEYHNNSFVQDDYIGQIIFESGIINEPIMQGETNDTYLNRNYQTYKYEICGPVFMDYACKKGDQNLVLYGHTRSTAVDPERVLMFTPLHVLEDINNYETNKTIYLVYEDCVDVYVVSSVYTLQTIQDENGLQYLKEGEPLYYLNNYSNSEFKDYINTIEKRQLYDTGIKVTSSDSLLTLQTCLEGSTDKLIVLAKKTETRKYQ